MYEFKQLACLPALAATAAAAESSSEDKGVTLPCASHPAAQSSGTPDKCHQQLH